MTTTETATKEKPITTTTTETQVFTLTIQTAEPLVIGLLRIIIPGQTITIKGKNTEMVTVTIADPTVEEIIQAMADNLTVTTAESGKK
jgi:hypothetical protein